MKLQFPINLEQINEERISISHCWGQRKIHAAKRGLRCIRCWHIQPLAKHYNNAAKQTKSHLHPMLRCSVRVILPNLLLLCS